MQCVVASIKWWLLMLVMPVPHFKEKSEAILYNSISNIFVYIIG